MNTSQLTGIVLGNLDFFGLSNGLQKVFANPSNLVFLIERSSGFLLGTSVLGQNITSLILATSSPLNLVASVSQWLKLNNYPQTLSVVGTNYVQLTRYNAYRGIDWWVVVVSPAPDAVDFVNPTSLVGIGVWIISGIGLLWSMLVAGALIWNRELKTLKAAQFELTLCFLIGCVGLNASSMLLLGFNSTVLCTARSWSFNLCFILTLSPLLLKTYRIHHIFNSESLSTTPLTMLALTLMGVCALAVDCVLLAVATATGGMDGIVLTLVCFAALA